MTPGNATDVQKFYKNCGVFLTGGTGFLGKLTVEKILRSCPDVGKVYVLVRPKKGLSVEERKGIMFDNVVFGRLKNERPGSLEKVVFVSGDCSAPRLGLSDSDYHDLTQQVNIVMHLAATVRFDEKMKVAINVNIKGAVEVIKLCRGCVSLKAGVFVSTAFSNPHHPFVKEEFYNPPMQLEEILSFKERVTERELEILSHKVTGSWKLPYLFSKAVIENIILTQANDLPLSIVRPSMVVCTRSEPLPGWVDNLYGPIAIVLGTATGMLKVNYANKDAILDVIPADVVANCIISAASTANERPNGTISIYNVTTSENNPLTVKMITETFFKYRDAFPVRKCSWYPFLITVANFRIYTFLTLFLHVLPGCLLDLALRLYGRPPMFIKLYKIVRKYAIITNQFDLKETIFSSSNTLKLYEKLDSKDKELFFFGMNQMNTREIIKTSCLESRKYLLNETLDDLEDAKSHCRKLRIVHTLVKYFLYGLAIWAAWKVIMAFIPDMF